MKILTSEAIRQWDQYTIQHEPISSIDLMERAAGKCVEWLESKDYFERHFHIYCSKGNNGGDGLAIARMLLQKECSVKVYILEFGHLGTADFQENLQRLHEYEADIHFIQTKENFHPCAGGEIIIDCLLGSGLNRPLEGVTKELVEHMNKSGCAIISIDIPTGLSADRSSKGNVAIKANYTLSFQCYKPAFLVAENAANIGELYILDIGLHPDHYKNISSTHELIDTELIRSIFKPRNAFAHKGHFGHAFIIAGSYGKMGAAILMSKACLRSGVGLLTCHLPKCGYGIMQTAVPEAMVMTDFNSSFNTKIETDLSKFDAVGTGPGMGTASETKTLLKEIMETYKGPLVLDADALNILASQQIPWSSLPPYSILTPHPKEFERLFGQSKNDFDRIELAKQKSKDLNVVIVLKGHHTFIATPGEKARPDDPVGRGYFNSTGNAGMATGGSGDVLTGILTGLLAQGYSPVEAAILGVYLHGLAGDIAAAKLSMEAMVAGDIIENLGKAFESLQKFKNEMH